MCMMRCSKVAVREVHCMLTNKRTEVACSRKEDMGIEGYVEGSRRDMVGWVERMEEVLEKRTSEVQAPRSIDQPTNPVT